jgi:hypothetical protein
MPLGLVSLGLVSLIKYNLNNFHMPVIFCKVCKETIYLDPHTYWTISDTSTRCEKCNTTNTITLENGVLKKQD